MDWNKQTDGFDIDQVRLQLGLLTEDVWLGDDNAMPVRADGASFFQDAQRAADRFRGGSQMIGDEGAGNGRMGQNRVFYLFQQRSEPDEPSQTAVPKISTRPTRSRTRPTKPCKTAKASW